MNRLLLTGIVVFIWAVSGCSNKDQAPGGILPKEKMQAVLWDIIQAERFTATFVAKDSTKNIKAENFKLYSQIFSIHQVTKDEFIKSYNFYLSRPDIARKMFDSLAAKANRQREDLYKSQTAPDSSKHLKSVLSPDSIHSHFRDSLMKANQQKLNSAKTNTPLVKPDSGKLTKPKRLIHPGLLRIRDSLLRRP